MGVSARVQIFGFGSYFSPTNRYPRDIDLLLLHCCLSVDSCRFVLHVKSMLSHRILNADVVMLSQTEAETNDFVSKSGAILLWDTSESQFSEHVNDVVDHILNYRNMQADIA